MRVFVYGSLKKNFGNHDLLRNSNFIGEALTEGRFTMLHLGGFPGVVEGGNTSIRGELYDVDDFTLRQLDRLEGHPSFYTRTVIKVLPVGSNDQWEEASVYLLPQAYLEHHSRIIDRGVWE